MKKWIRFFIWFLVITTWFFQIYKFLGSEWGNVEVIKENKQVSLNEFIWNYQSGSFQKIKLNNDTDLDWYIYMGTGKTIPLMTLRKSFVEQNYIIYQSKKPLSSSLQDLWISMTGKVLIDVWFDKKSAFEKILEQVLPILLFLLAFLLIAKFAMPKWWWGFPFNIKAWKLSDKTKMKTRFEDVAGMEEVKMELSEMVDYLKNPEKYHKVWARHPKWVLLYGQPWSGKTLLARAVAWESNVPFFSASGSEFMEMLVGMWAAKVRELFGKAKAVWRAIIFIDEIDAIGKKRWSGYTGGHQEQEQTLNQILTEMDGFDNTTNVIVIAATNRPDTLDPALLRAWRFDRKVMVSAPTYEERIMIFQYYLKNKKTTKKISLESLAKRTSWLVWADIETIVNEASLKIAKENRNTIDWSDFEYALEKVLMWPEKKIKSLKEEEKRIVTYHELGHAVTAYNLPKVDPVEKISIVRRGQALWVTWMSPEEDKYLYSKSKFLDELVSLLGGRAAEEIFFGKENITTWASNDFQKATDIVLNMLVKYGMDEDLWTISYRDWETEDYKAFRNYSEKTAEIIDKKVKEYLSDAYDKSKSIIKTNRENIDKMAKVLFEKEYLTREEFERMMKDISYAEMLMKDIVKK